MTPRPGAPKKSKQFPNLYKYPDSQFWVFRKWSSEKQKSFKFSTGEANNQAVAYKIGWDAFNLWLGKSIAEIEDGPIKFHAFANEILERKLAQPESLLSRNSKLRSKSDFETLIKEFGHLRVEQVTSERWDTYVLDELSNPQEPMRYDVGTKSMVPIQGAKAKPRKFYNRRKALIEIMRKAAKESLVKECPEFKNPDSEEDSGEYLPDDQLAKIYRKASPSIRRLIFIMRRSGARPGEILQYQWTMIKWEEGTHGRLYVPAEISKTRRKRDIPLNSRVARYLNYAHKYSKSPFVFPSRRHAIQHLGNYRSGWEQACSAAGVVANIYWIRGTWITDQLEKGISSVFIAKYCDTSSAMIDKRYAKSKQTIMEKIAE